MTAVFVSFVCVLYIWVHVILVCGSPGEAANDYLTFDPFNVATDRDHLPTSQSTLNQQRKTVWYNIALRSPDQLRQRMAWCVSKNDARAVC